MIGDKLALPQRKRVRARGGHAVAQAAGNVGNGAAQYRNITKRFIHIVTNIRTYFYHGLVHFGFYLVFDHLLAFLHNALLMALQFQRLRINHHVFFFYPNRERLII
jgi:hypothetical protein